MSVSSLSNGREDLAYAMVSRYVVYERALLEEAERRVRAVSAIET